MEITYFGHSSFRLKGKSASVVTDPYDAEMVGLKFPKISAEMVTVSHDHKDHNRSDLVNDVRMIINQPGEYEVQGISIIGIKTFYDGKSGSERVINTVYIFEIDGLRLAHLGDLGHKLDDQMVEELGALDVLMIPVGGVYTIDSTTASEIVRSIEPSIIIPMHYKIAGMNPETFGELAELEVFLKEIGLPVEESDKLVVKKGEIPEGESKVVVLKPRV